MLTYQGKYASCNVMIDEIEPECVKQLYSILNCPAYENSTIRIMPDCHAGSGCVIGFTGTFTDKVCPNAIGVDIGCGILATKLPSNTKIDFERFDHLLRSNVPSGFSIHEKENKFHSVSCDNFGISECAEKTGQDVNRVKRSLGTLGGGNHYIEVGKDQNDELWLTVHSGSRNFGYKIAQHYQKLAVESVGKHGGLEWLEDTNLSRYLFDMKIAKLYAYMNRHAITKILVESLDISMENCHHIETVHNYIEGTMIRKGAISAMLNELVVIPWNMRDGMIIGTGKGNTDWNSSAPHGAGRVMGRSQAKKILDVDTFIDSMSGIYTTSVSRHTLDESPMVYKDHNLIQSLIKDTVDVNLIVKPLYNFKASE